ncbi:MAG: GFA family protein [Methyloligellaceae bacterium]
MEKSFRELYAPDSDQTFAPKYVAGCHCGTVAYAVSADPLDAKICHCRACQKLHGAPMQLAAIFHKAHVRFTKGIDRLQFYNSELNRSVRVLPCKVSCSVCRALIADEGRRMWLAFPSLFEFAEEGHLPDAFKPTCHIFYGTRLMDIKDGLPKWSGHKGSPECRET